MTNSPQWLYPLRRTTSEPTARLLVFPYAAAGANSLRPLVTRLPERIELLGVALPGRERRFGESPSTSHEEIVAGVLDDLRRREPLTTHLFGHSMGASLALALAVTAPECCHGVVISGRPPAASALAAMAQMTNEQILQFLGAAGQTNAKLLADEFWRHRLLGLYRSDVRLDVATSRAIGQCRLDHHLVVLGGADDPYVAPAGLAGWAQRTIRDCDVHLLPGSHFYLLDPVNFPAIVEVLTAAVAAPELAHH